MLELDATRGTVTVEAGVQWPALLGYLSTSTWSIAQKQTGADRLTIGGAISANAHGRGLRMAPLVSDVEELTVVGPNGS